MTPAIRKALFSCPVLALFLLLAGILGWGGSRYYFQRRDRMVMAAAARAVDTGDFRSAWVWLQRLYTAHPDDIATNRLIARFGAAEHSPEELAWRARVVQIGPATMDDYLDWAAVALRLGQTDVAREALEQVPAAWQQNARFHELYANTLVALGQPQAADDQFAAAAQLEPSNPVHLANLAALRLSAADDDQTQGRARATLEHLATTSTAPLPAIRALLNDALRQHDRSRIAHFRAVMRQRSDRTLDDELACSTAAPDRQEGHAELTTLWNKVEAGPIETLQVAEWMIRLGDAAEVFGWLRNLPAAEQSDVGIQTGEADALTELRDWSALRAFLDGKNWRDCDFLRVALLVRCTRESGGSAPLWRDAVASCHRNGSDLLLLAQTAASWSWQSDAEALYWEITELGYPCRGPALKALWDFYGAAGNTGGLLRVAREQFRDRPKDPEVCNNFAFLSLLSGIGATDASRIAREDFMNHPENPNVAATYAYSLYLDGRYQDGLRVLSPFGEQRLQVAGTALYLALLQQAAGQKDAATRSAAAIDPRKLLPEERVLLEKIGSKT